jgi:hypothetical protein
MKLRPMKLKALLLALAVAGTAAAFGLTDTGRSDTGTGTGTTATTTTTTTTTGGGDCKRFWLAGSITSVGTTSFTLAPLEGRHSTAPAAPVTVTITADTRVFWQGKGSLAGPGVGDVASVFGAQCGATATARLVLVHPAPKGAQGDAKPPEHRH